MLNCYCDVLQGAFSLLKRTLQANMGKLVRSRLVFGFKYLSVNEIGNGDIIPKSLSFNVYSLQKQLNKVKIFTRLEVLFKDDYANLLKQSFTVSTHHLKRCVSTQFRTRLFPSSVLFVYVCVCVHIEIQLVASIVNFSCLIQTYLVLKKQTQPKGNKIQ